jgi:hypothetical protein
MVHHRLLIERGQTRNVAARDLAPPPPQSDWRIRQSSYDDVLRAESHRSFRIGPAPWGVAGRQWNARHGAQQLYEVYQRYDLGAEDYEGPRYKRLAHLQKLIAASRVDQSLRWTTT